MPVPPDLDVLLPDTAMHPSTLPGRTKEGLGQESVELRRAGLVWSSPRSAGFARAPSASVPDRPAAGGLVVCILSKAHACIWDALPRPQGTRRRACGIVRFALAWFDTARHFWPSHRKLSRKSLPWGIEVCMGYPDFEMRGNARFLLARIALFRCHLCHLVRGFKCHNASGWLRFGAFASGPAFVVRRAFRGFRLGPAAIDKDRFRADGESHTPGNHTSAGFVLSPATVVVLALAPDCASRKCASHKFAHHWDSPTVPMLYRAYPLL